MIYVYAVTDRPAQPLPSQRGLRGQKPSKVVWRDIAAVVSACDGAAPSASADEVWRHEAVVESLMSDCTVVPMRFGTLAPSRQHVGDILCQKYRALAEDIERVRGHVEIGMRFLTTIDVDAGADRPPACNGFQLSGTGPGSAYLRERVAKERHSRERRRGKLRLVRGVYDRLAIHAHESRFDEGGDDRRGIAAAFLVPRNRIAAFREIVGAVADANPGVALLCTGPWPPYSFVGTALYATNRSGTRHAS